MVAVIDEELPTLTPVAATPPIVTVALETKFAPEIVTGVPPPVPPADGLIVETDGPGPVPRQEATETST